MKLKFILLTGLVTLIFACQSDIEVPVIEGEEGPRASNLRQDIDLTSVEQQMSVYTNTFAFNLLQRVYANESPSENILLSPLSATLALSMLHSGAVGTTGEEIRQTLGFDNVSRDAINKYAQKIISAMQTLDSRGVFESANLICIKQEFPVLNQFKQINQQYYDAEIRNVDFTQEAATLKLINSWSNEKTHGKIPEILKNIDPLTLLLLGNALYFKGYWTTPFNKEASINAVFSTSSGVEQMVPTMQMTSSSLHYALFNNYAAVELPFGNEAFSLVVILPDEDTDISDIIAQMDGDLWAQAITVLGNYPYDAEKGDIIPVEIHLQIPRFKMEYERTLNNDLMAMGMKTPFMETADFSLISQFPLWISGVKQKTFVQMDENGMEAAAVTVINQMGSTGIKYTPVDFKVNRPFLYFIKEKSTGLIFFAGMMNKIS